jgi:glycosyltransferase involved in cell wall biosynthesis
VSASAAPLVSVVTAVLNGMPYVARSLDSVQEQDYRPLEHWVIDGGSTDGTVDAIRAREARLAGWVSEKDRGIADAFNKGLERARGEYVMFLNADDELASPDALSRALEFASAAGFPDVLYGDCDVVDRQSGAFLYRHARDYDPARFLRFAILPHPSMLMHRRYFERHGRFDASYRVAMDYELQLRGVPACGAMRAPVVVTRVRTGGESTLDPRRVMDENIRALRSTGHLGAAGALGYRALYGARFAARGVLQRLGLYRAFTAMRHGARRAQGR